MRSSRLRCTNQGAFGRRATTASPTFGPSWESISKSFQRAVRSSSFSSASSSALAAGKPTRETRR